MRVVHDPDGRARDLATTVEFAESPLEQAAGLMGRRSLPDGYALVFPFEAPPWPLSRWFDAVGRRTIHMLFVRVPLDVLWLVDGEVRRVETLPPWRGLAVAKADTVIELPAGAADGVEAGDEVAIVDGATGEGD